MIPELSSRRLPAPDQIGSESDVSVVFTPPQVQPFHRSVLQNRPAQISWAGRWRWNLHSPLFIIKTIVAFSGDCESPQRVQITQCLDLSFLFSLNRFHHNNTVRAECGSYISVCAFTGSFHIGSPERLPGVSSLEGRCATAFKGSEWLITGCQLCQSLTWLCSPERSPPLSLLQPRPQQFMAIFL